MAHSPIEFFCDVLPTPKQSYRSARGGGYTNPQVKDNADHLAARFWPHRPRVPMVGPVCCTYMVEYRYRANEKKSITRDGQRIPKDTGADCDNLAKQISDVLQRCRFFNSDSQIVELKVSKWWGPVAGVQILVEPWE